MIHSSSPTPTTVYVAWTSSGEPLYVGISACFGARANQHRGDSAWWTEAAVIHVEHFSTRTEAERREAELIARLDPAFNVRLKSRPEAVRVSPGFARAAKAARRRADREDLVYALRMQGLSWRAVAAQSGLRDKVVQQVAQDLRRQGRLALIRPGQRFTP